MNTMANQKIKPPAIGAFPFYERSKNLFMIWARLLDEQSAILNEQWGKLKDGKYKIEDNLAALAKMVERSVSRAEDMLLQGTELSPSPPWVSLEAADRQDRQVKLRVTLGRSDVLSGSKLSKLGGDPQKGYVVPEVDAVTVTGDARAIKVIVTNPKAKVEAGQYIGFIMRSTSPEPIAIVTVTK